MDLKSYYFQKYLLCLFIIGLELLENTELTGYASKNNFESYKKANIYPNLKIEDDNPRQFNCVSVDL